MSKIHHSPTAKLSSVAGYRPGGATVSDGSGAAQPVLPPGWKPYVYRGTNFDLPPFRHGSIEAVREHEKSGTKACRKCRKLIRELEAQAQEQEVVEA